MVELDLLARDLWCQPCDKALPLREALKETRNGLSSEIDIYLKKVYLLNTQ